MSFVLRTVAVATVFAFKASASYPVAVCTDDYGIEIPCPDLTSDSPSYTQPPVPAYPTGFPNSTVYPSAIEVPGWKYVGCVSSSNPSEFSLVETSSAMSIERCLLDCSAYEYALVHADQCYCAQEKETVSDEPGGLCHTPCPADPAEACGGEQGVPPYRRYHQKRAESSPIVGGPLYSLYEKAIVPDGDLYVTVITQIYIDICDTCPGGTSTCTASSTATLTGCGCTTPYTPVIPMVTTIAPCQACLHDDVLTITVPEICTTSEVLPTSTPCPTPIITHAVLSPVYPGASTAVPHKPVFTGAANALQKGAAGAAALFAGLALL